MWAPSMLAQGDPIRTSAYHKQSDTDTPVDRFMSPMGRLAQRTIHGLTTSSARGKGGIRPLSGPDVCPQYDECDNGDSPQDAASGGQAETTIAMDPTGKNIVIGYNDT